MAHTVTGMNRLNLFTSSSERHIYAFSVIFKFFIFWLVLALLFFSIITPQYIYGYNASLIDKVNRLQSLDSPKIVLIGNSNLSFGIRSHLLEDEFDMPVVNMGLHGGLGNAFHEQMAKLNVKSGDIIIICHSTFGDDDTISDPVLAWTTIENHPILWKLLRAKDFFTMADGFSIYLKRCLNLYISGNGNALLTDTSYSRTAFNEYGDNIYSDYVDEDWTFTSGSIVVPSISDACVKRLNDLNKWITEKGAILLIAAYPIGDCQYTPDPKEYDEFESKLRSMLDAPVISHYRDYFFPEEDFYNAILHLNSEGAVKRTRQLILDLKDYFGNN